MAKSFEGKVRTSRRNRLQEDIEKGTAEPTTTTEPIQPETSPKMGALPKTEPTKAALDSSTEKSGQLETEEQANADQLEKALKAAKELIEAEDRKKRLTEGRTQGKKGLRLKRINMAFTPDVYHYIQVMGKSCEGSMTAFVNETLRRQMDRDKEYHKMEKLKDERLIRMIEEERRLKEYDDEINGE